LEEKEKKKINYPGNKNFSTEKRKAGTLEDPLRRERNCGVSTCFLKLLLSQLSDGEKKKKNKFL
jgi:hypothetical protein